MLFVSSRGFEVQRCPLQVLPPELYLTIVGENWSPPSILETYLNNHTGVAVDSRAYGQQRGRRKRPPLPCRRAARFRRNLPGTRPAAASRLQEPGGDDPPA